MGNGLKEQRVPSSLGAVREQGNSMIGCLVSVTVSLLCIVLRQNYEVALLFGFWVLGFFFHFIMVSEQPCLRLVLYGVTCC